MKKAGKGNTPSGLLAFVAVGADRLARQTAASCVWV